MSPAEEQAARLCRIVLEAEIRRLRQTRIDALGNIEYWQSRRAQAVDGEHAAAGARVLAWQSTLAATDTKIADSARRLKNLPL